MWDHKERKLVKEKCKLERESKIMQSNLQERMNYPSTNSKWRQEHKPIIYTNVSFLHVWNPTCSKTFLVSTNISSENCENHRAYIL